MFKRAFSTTVRLAESETKTASTSWVKPAQGSPKIHDLLSQTFDVLTDKRKEEPVKISDKFAFRYDAGDNYDPFDFNITSAIFSNSKIKYPKTFNIKPTGQKSRDTFTRQGINPLDLYCSPLTLSRFLTPGGKIMPRKQTGLTQKNHNLIAKAIRRARAIGFLSSVHQDIRFVPTRGS